MPIEAYIFLTEKTSAYATSLKSELLYCCSNMFSSLLRILFYELEQVDPVIAY